MKLIHTLLFCLSALLYSCADTVMRTDNEHTIWFDRPASAWEETLPLGNGRLGMMPDGGIDEELIVLNEISLWSGCEVDYANPDAAESLPLIRELLLEGRNAQAQKVMYERFVPHKPTDGGTYGSYQTLGELKIRHHGLAEDISGYRRWLDLRTATAFTEYSCGGRKHSRKYYVSKDHDVMIIEMEAEGGIMNFDVNMSRSMDCMSDSGSDSLLKISGRLDSGTEMPGMG